MKKKRNKLGFTIVELLTVMAIIAILMGLLVPALNQVRKLAKDTSQRAQFHSIDVALEAFQSEYGMYPESSVSPTTFTAASVGAHKLAEALVGRDLLGFDPKTTWDADNDDDSGNPDYKDIYANQNAPQSSPPEKVEASLKRRMGPYINTDEVESFQVGQLFAARGGVYPGNLDSTGTPDTAYVAAPVLTDVYHAKRVTLANGSTLMAGTPILYYKANTKVVTKSFCFPDTMNVTPSDSSDDYTGSETVADANDDGFIYNIMDNDELVNLFQMMKPTSLNRHKFDVGQSEDFDADGTNENGVWNFYNVITNPKMTSHPRPYNMDSYILISAGADGIYGTRDDIFNFKQ
ncbi:MAG: hypothetical protein A2Y10_20475 [Planctomycetes bacterium GWF2_41_51]|nr:MAG: hypothetical protein A2Y10_20475 [Planctomycetes bacterium GWF2_41_51]HBG25710.1 hypothetical protein [Phycisphaerales bacterium]